MVYTSSRRPKEKNKLSIKSQQILQVFFLCHQRSDRSFHCNGKQFPLCARCTGMAVGYSISIPILIAVGLIDLRWLVVLILPMAIDGIGQLINLWVSTNVRRFVTGLAGGIAISFLFFLVCQQFFLWGRYVGNII